MIHNGVWTPYTGAHRSPKMNITKEKVKAACTLLDCELEPIDEEKLTNLLWEH
jgi:hypothetical protein